MSVVKLNVPKKADVVVICTYPGNLSQLNKCLYSKYICSIVYQENVSRDIRFPKLGNKFYLFFYDEMKQTLYYYYIWKSWKLIPF